MAERSSDEVGQLLAYVRSHVTEIHNRAEGWPGNVELALIDTVLSIRARYGVSVNTGVRGAIGRYKTESGRKSWDDLSALADVDPDWLARVLTNRQKTGGVLKAEAIVAAAGRLSAAGVKHSADVDRDAAAHRAAYCGTRGLGPVTWAYFLMLIGHDGVKPDTLLTRFIAQALGTEPSAQAVTQLVAEAAQRLEMPASQLDHSIWRHMSNPRRS